MSEDVIHSIVLKMAVFYYAVLGLMETMGVEEEKLRLTVTMVRKVGQERMRHKPSLR